MRFDPHLVTIGRNVIIGFNATISGHGQERDMIVFRRTVLADDVLIGGHAVIFGGVPARKIRDVPPIAAVAGGLLPDADVAD